jgi:hypothetical protein
MYAFDANVRFLEIDLNISTHSECPLPDHYYVTVKDSPSSSVCNPRCREKVMAMFAGLIGLVLVTFSFGSLRPKLTLIHPIYAANWSSL